MPNEVTEIKDIGRVGTNPTYAGFFRPTQTRPPERTDRSEELKRIDRLCEQAGVPRDLRKHPLCQAHEAELQRLSNRRDELIEQRDKIISDEIESANISNVMSENFRLEEFGKEGKEKIQRANKAIEIVEEAIREHKCGEGSAYNEAAREIREKLEEFKRPHLERARELQAELREIEELTEFVDNSLYQIGIGNPSYPGSH